MDTQLREFLMERKLEDVIQKLEDENIDETVIPLMTDSDLAKYIPKVGDRVSTVAFCRQAALSQKSPSRKESILSKLRQRLSGADGMPPKKKLSQWAGNTNAKRKLRRIEVGWMDFDEEEERYKQVRAVSGGGTRHLSIDKDETVANIKGIAENLFFPEGQSKKNKSLSHYSTHIESSQIHVEVSNTVDELYSQSKVRMLRLYLCTKKTTRQQPSRVEAGDHEISQPSVVDLTDNEQSQAIEDLFRNSESPNHYGINDGASTSDNLELNDTLPWDGLLTLDESKDSDAIIIISGDVSYVTVDEPNLETPFPEKEDDAPHQTVDLSPVLAGEAGVPAQALPEPLSCPVTLIIRRGHCLTDLISAFKDPKIIASEVNIKMHLPNGELEQGEGNGVLRDCLTEFWMDFYDSCTLGVEVKVPFIRHDFQCEEWQAVARVFVVGWKQAGYFPVKLAIPFLEEVLYGSTTSSFKDSFLLYVSQEERSVLLKALEDFNSVDTDELLDILDAHECKQVPTKDTLLPVLAQIGHKVIVQAPMYVIKCWRPVVGSVAGLLPQEGLHHFITQKKPTAKTVKGLLNFPEEMTAAQSTVSRYLKRYIGEIDCNHLQLFLRFCTGSDLLDNVILIEFIETTDFLRRPQSHTCGCVLKLPIGYNSYPDFRSEFNNILTSSMWVMDVV
ncbi:uncharacterized protein LOC114463690 [Gouania willdenowi]|uniref:uncharacterized protein LOC114454950 n=1 Tax=Gouania willdenowi TaxID=441366 RepID=UPI00105535BC|nr:uncharacterized protein LOC114454950 [Gouania willdenowi]XP_028291709.1 uncharacterized protein LOC114454950 [Gouania willdenowi]XP_028291710.1 uncharacterized protein LOC114454950 [Gouania willdenowi]XP_028291711.1 uncharacterized protein LOC114454950 [Gouania willdenowi]XP_028303201.1 uncharacterized protein LOC114463690 [Gouania willdenowi]XP_028303202.1 uncharacterized protein LOC114463690 [Gouania willdenowi]XP_028303203.1 uncharacterized protein LOC114463690 [Gouania willdenowi]XP_0